MTLKEKFISILQETHRPGMDVVLANLEKEGFFEAPASARFHLNREGGLLEHSLNVYEAALKVKEDMAMLNPSLIVRLPGDSIAISALLHDVCKSDIYHKEIQSRKNAAGNWEKYEGYKADYKESFPIGHGEKSVIMLLRWGLEMTDAEMLAIRWHMAPWDLPLQSGEHKESLNAAKTQSPLVALIQIADQIATHLIETE